MWLQKVLTLAAVGVVVSLGTGCGALSAAANPKIAWAINDPAPMTVVVRRADAAEATSKEVDRLLTQTPVTDAATWPAETAPSPDDAQKQMKELAEFTLYKDTHARVVPAEVWARSLAQVKAEAPATKTAAAPAKGAKGAKPADAKSGKKSSAKTAATPTATPTAASVATGRKSSLIATIDDGLGDKYAAVMGKRREIGGIKKQVATEEAALDAKGLGDADKKTHKDKIASLGKDRDALEGEVKTMSKEFLAAVKTSAGNVPTDVKDRVAPALVNLRQAVEDASISNGAAAVKYPLAVRGIPDSLKTMAGVYACDIIQEQTGHRPIIDALKPDVSFDDGTVSLTLNGISPSDLGKISIGDLTTQTTVRLQNWSVHTVGLLGSIAATQDVLGFEGDVLDAFINGFATGGWKAPAAANLDGAGGGAGASGGISSGSLKPGGLVPGLKM